MGPKRDPRTGRFIRTGSTDIGEDSSSSSFEEPIQTPPATVQRIVSQVEPNTPTPAPTTTRIPHIMADSDGGVGASGGQQADLAMKLRLAELEKDTELARRENLRMQLRLAELNQANPNSNTTPNPSQTSIQIVHDKVADFRKEVTAKNLKMTFKLEGSSNYDNWRDEALTQALAIKAKDILKNKELTCPDDLMDNDRRIWEIKQEAIFDMLLAGLKPAIRQ